MTTVFNFILLFDLSSGDVKSEPPFFDFDGRGVYDGEKKTTEQQRLRGAHLHVLELILIISIAKMLINFFKRPRSQVH